MATLNNLTNLIANAKSTPSGKIEWTDTSLKGIQAEVEYLFSQNAIQVVNNTTTLQSTINDNSQLVFVTSDPTLANNGIYFWNLTAVSTINFPAGSNGFWNLIQFGVTSAIGAGYIPYSNGSNFLPSWLKQTVDEIKMMGGSFVANRSTSTGPYFQSGDTDAVGNKITLTVDDKNQLIYSKKNTSNVGIKLDFANNIHKIGSIDANKGLSVDTANTVYKLGNTSTGEGVVVNASNGYIGNSTWNYSYTATTLFAGNASINLSLNDTVNAASLGSGTKGLTVDVTNNVYTLGDGTKGLNVNADSDDYTLGSTTYGLVVDATVALASTAFLGSISTGNGLSIFNGVSGDIYSLANQTVGKGLFIDLSTETYQLGAYNNYGLNFNATAGRLGSTTLNYRYTATTASVGTSSLLLNIDNTAGSASLGAVTRGLFMQISGGSPTYSLGNLSGQIGLFLGQTTGYLGNSTFGYNYTATTMIAGNSSINLTLDDTANTANVGTSTKGLLVDATNNLYRLGDFATSTGLFLGATTGYLGSTIFGYNYTATAITIGNASINLSLNDSTNVGQLGSGLLNVKVDATNGKASINGTTTYGIELWDSIQSVYTYGASGVEGLYVDLFGHNYSLGGNNVALNISNTGKTLQTILNPSGVGTNINGLNFDYTADTYLLGGEYATKSAAIGVKGSRTATPQVQVGSDLVVAAAVGGTQLEKIRVFIPGVGVRYIPVYLS
jgi:hypothetical protein